MSKISFNAQALGIASYHTGSDMGHAIARSANQTFVVFRPGIEAIIEGLRLANVQGFEAAGSDLSAGDVDP